MGNTTMVSPCDGSRQCFCHIICRDPLVVYYYGDQLDEYAYVHAAFANQRMYIVKGSAWDQDNPALLAHLKHGHDQFARQYPHHEMFYLCNTQTATDQHQAVGLNAWFCHQNAFIDYDLFTIHGDTPKQFDAIMNAAVARWKRQELAVSIPSVAWITYRIPDYPGAYEEICSLVPQIHCMNFEAGSYAYMSERKIARNLARARVGLMLSAVEGGCYACVEYMLAGLPVVSTPSLGGRDVFFDEEYVRIVEPEPGNIARAVQELIDLRIDPELIRSKTMARMAHHRQTFFSNMQEILDRECADRSYEHSEWPHIYINKIHRYQPLGSLPCSPRP